VHVARHDVFLRSLAVTSRLLLSWMRIALGHMQPYMYATLCLFGGILLSALLGKIVHMLDENHTHALHDNTDTSVTADRDVPMHVIRGDDADVESPSADSERPESAVGESATRTVVVEVAGKQKTLRKTGLMTALAISIHNFPVRCRLRAMSDAPLRGGTSQLLLLMTTMCPAVFRRDWQHTSARLQTQQLASRWRLRLCVACRGEAPPRLLLVSSSSPPRLFLVSSSSPPPLLLPSVSPLSLGQSIVADSFPLSLYRRQSTTFRKACALLFPFSTLPTADGGASSLLSCQVRCAAYVPGRRSNS
jgi:hypothetical protein